ncbi:hypothetical protein HOK00_04210 [bacterium]|nr:hypothetical protein [bacterium]
MIDYGEFFGILAALLAVFIYLPQLILILKTKQTRDISLLFLILILLCNISWGLNGYFENSLSRLFSGIIIIIMTLPMLYFKLKNNN